MVVVNSLKLKQIKDAERKVEILKRLEEIDSEILRPLRAIVAKKNKEADDQKFSALEAEADALRTELRGLS